MNADDLRHDLRPQQSDAELLASITRICEATFTTEAAAAVADLVEAREARLLADADADASPLEAVAGLFQQVESREAYETLAGRGLPVLRRTFDRLVAEAGKSARRRETLVFLAKIFSLYRLPEDLRRVVIAAREPALRDHPLWTMIFGVFDDDHPLRIELHDALREPLPAGFAGVAYLDLANALARSGEATPHPFDVPDGRRFLEDRLTDADRTKFSHAHSAAAALPFVADPPRERLLALAFDHASPRVQMEAAWASAKLGSRAGVQTLARACLDPRQGAVAVDYLTELGETNAIPARAMEPGFAAVAELCRWLAHPMEFGRPPDDATLLDARTLFWPPANESRTLRLVRYLYRNDAGGEEAAGIGLVGSITFALFGETNADLPPEDVYSLHCCWELEVERDPRAPQQRSVAAGRELLRNAGNEGF